MFIFSACFGYNFRFRKSASPIQFRLDWLYFAFFLQFVRFFPARILRSLSYRYFYPVFPLFPPFFGSPLQISCLSSYQSLLIATIDFNISEIYVGSSLCPTPGLLLDPSQGDSFSHLISAYSTLLARDLLWSISAQLSCKLHLFRCGSLSSTLHILSNC